MKKTIQSWGIDQSWSLFLDRDGVINTKRENDYVKTIEEFEFIDGVLAGFSILNCVFNHVFLITNQQGVGKGIMTMNDLDAVHRFMMDELKKNNGFFDKLYVAPQLAKDKSMFRKPNPGMAIQAQSEFESVCFKTSVLIGDSESDIAVGKNLGMKTVFIHQNPNVATLADIVLPSLTAFYNLIK